MKPALSENYDPLEPVVAAIRTGDRFAFAELVRRENRFVRGVLMGVLGEPDRADEVSQVVWTTFWGRIKELRDVSSWRSWLYRLARNAAIDAGRDTTRRRKRLQEYQQEPAPRASTTTPDRTLVEGEEHGEVLDAIQALPALYREPFVMRHLMGFSYRQIGEVMDMPVDSVETRLVRARRMLREALSPKDA